jgi:predicted RNA polymerase sigma factor
VTVEAVFRREYGRCVATLIRFLGDIDAAEEAVQDAFTVAVARWPSDGQPPNRCVDRHDRPQPGHRRVAPRVGP